MPRSLKAKKPTRAATAGAWIASSLALVGIWKLASVGQSELVLPPPERVAEAFAAIVARPGFWLAIGESALRCLLGFTYAAISGLALGLAAGSFPLAGAALRPPLSFAKSMPVIALILILSLSFESGQVPIVSSFLMCLPVFALAVEAGVKSMDQELVEMARLFGVPGAMRLTGLYLPAIAPYFASACETSIGLSWKVVVAAEVLSQPARAIGSALQEAKVYLESAEVFAWALAALALSGGFDLAFHGARRAFGRHA
jgi:NitT/TauT family transport system permease protein